MVGWLVDERWIEPHVKLMDKSERMDGTFSRSDFIYDPEANVYVCPGGKELKKYHWNFSKPRDGLTKSGTLLYFARKHDCDVCALKPKCCPNMPARKIPRSIHEAARDEARDRQHRGLRGLMSRTKEGRDALRPPEAHPRLGKLRLRGRSGAKDEFLLAATAQNLRKLAKLIPFRRRSSPHEANRPISSRLDAIATVIPLVGPRGILQRNRRKAGLGRRAGTGGIPGVQRARRVAGDMAGPPPRWPARGEADLLGPSPQAQEDTPPRGLGFSSPAGPLLNPSRYFDLRLLAEWPRTPNVE